MSKAISVYGNNIVMDDTLDGNDAALHDDHDDMLDMNDNMSDDNIQVDGIAGEHRRTPPATILMQ